MKITVVYTVMTETEIDVSDRFLHLRNCEWGTEDWCDTTYDLTKTLIKQLPSGAEINAVIDTEKDELIFEN